jgi:hypothetical protein
LVGWKCAKDGTGAVLVQGAPRVGKTTTATEFMKIYYDDFAVVDLKDASEELKDAVRACPSRPDGLADYLRQTTGSKMRRGRSAILFNDVQLFPEVRGAIDALVGSGACDCVETGCLPLVGFRRPALYGPTIETVFTMHPMDFEEFLYARGIAGVVPVLERLYARGRPVGGELHDRSMTWFRQYMSVGGMPEAVEAFLGYGLYEDADLAKRSVLREWKQALHDGGWLPAKNIEGTIESIVTQLREGQEYFERVHDGKPTCIDPAGKSIGFLTDAGMAVECTSLVGSVDAPDLNGARSHSCLYVSDTGLLLTKIELMNENPLDKRHRGVVVGDLVDMMPYAVRNVVAQMIVARGYNLHRQTIKLDPDAAGAARHSVDFVCMKDGVATPVVVYAGGHVPPNKLSKFGSSPVVPVDRRILLWDRDVRQIGACTCMPYYMAACI